MTQQTNGTPQNKAAWQVDKTGTLEVRDAPYTQPCEHEIVIRNRAVAINPIDWIFQQLGNGLIFQWLKYPTIMGYDVAGEVVETGSNVTRFKPGDRVLAMATGHDENINRTEEAGYQLYPIIREHMATPIPSTMSYESASTIPLGTATAACGLFQHDKLALSPPTLNPTPTGKWILIWGGSSSVGSSAVQLAVAAGYSVVTTCSPRNFDLVKRLGASSAFDYKDVKLAISQIVDVLKDKDVVGAFSIGDGAVDACFDVLCECKRNNNGDNKDKFIAVATKSQLVDPKESFAMLKTVHHYLAFHSSLWFKSKTRGTKYKLIFADTLVHDGVGKTVFEDYLPQALEQGKYVVTAEPLVVGTGLEAVQEGYEVQKKGVSARKVVVSL